MPRQARIDFPGALHHVIVRGLERREIFRDDADRRSFVERLGRTLAETATPCYAWALVGNHLHLLLETGKRPIGRVLQSVLTGYAVSFNRRHRRDGHLFQGRYKSILCEREAYLLGLVRYIHLNPLRAGLVRGMDALDRYPWTGHAVLLGNREAAWQAADEVLGLFGKRAGEARRRYRGFVADGAGQGYREDLVGGGLVRSLGGWEAVAQARRSRERHPFDERILGSGDFVLRALKAADERETRTRRLRREGWTFDRVLARAAGAVGLKPGDLRGNGKRRPQSAGRALACKWLADDLGMTVTEAARRLRITQPAASLCVAKGRALERERRVPLDGENVIIK